MTRTTTKTTTTKTHLSLSIMKASKQQKPSRFKALSSVAYLLVCIQFQTVVHAKITCDNDLTCEKLLRTGSKCINGACSNPFEKGCLRSMRGEEDWPIEKNWPVNRICNSDDSPDAAKNGICNSHGVDPLLDYMEIRISPGNWESSIFNAWVIQILLSELLNVPVSIDTAGLSFYDSTNSMTYPDDAYRWDALERAHEVGDCRLTTNTSCAHVMPELWSGQSKNMEKYSSSGVIENVGFTGYIGRLDYFIPVALAKQEPALASSYGLQGEENRNKLAETFKRPLNWLDYCKLANETPGGGCNESDNVAKRWPNNGTAENDSYFSEGGYSGYFHATDQNNCTMNPQTCTGHIVKPPCGWSYYLEQHIHWNDIALTSNGPSDLQEYSYGQMVQIIKASNATGSNIIIAWWEPEPFPDLYNLTPVSFTRPNLECLDFRVTGKDRCSTNVTEERGDPAGACGYETISLRKVVSSVLSLKDKETSEALRSPGHAVINALRFSNVQVDSILNEWLKYGLDTYGYDPRLAVCEWVDNNLEALVNMTFPSGYPRNVDRSTFDNSLTYTAMSLAAIVTAAIALIFIATYNYREVREMKYSQVDFLLLTLVGYLLVTVGAMVATVTPSAASCVSSEWLVNIGYTLGVAPLLVKVAAVNRLVFKSRNMQRSTLKLKNLYLIVLGMVSAAIFFMIVWSFIDPPGEVDEVTLNGDNHIEVLHRCESSSDMWVLIALAWRALLLFVAAVLVFQSSGRKTKTFDEAGTLGAMVYSRFMFCAMTIVLYFLNRGYLLPASTSVAAYSIILTLDASLTMAIYFVPKLSKAKYGENERAERANRLASQFSTYTEHRPSLIVDPVSNSAITGGRTGSQRSGSGGSKTISVVTENVEHGCSGYANRQNVEKEMSLRPDIMRGAGGKSESQLMSLRTLLSGGKSSTRMNKEVEEENQEESGMSLRTMLSGGRNSDKVNHNSSIQGRRGSEVELSEKSSCIIEVGNDSSYMLSG